MLKHIEKRWAGRSEQAGRSEPPGRSELPGRCREHINRKRGPHPSVKGSHPLDQ